VPAPLLRSRDLAVFFQNPSVAARIFFSRFFRVHFLHQREFCMFLAPRLSLPWFPQIRIGQFDVPAQPLLWPHPPKRIFSDARDVLLVSLVVLLFPSLVSYRGVQILEEPFPVQTTTFFDDLFLSPRSRIPFLRKIPPSSFSGSRTLPSLPPFSVLCFWDLHVGCPPRLLIPSRYTDPVPFF